MSNIVNFTGIPTTTKKPGKYFEFNYTMASRALATNDQKLVIIGQRTTASTAVESLTPIDVFSSSDVAAYFGHGSQVHRMADAAMKANGYLQLSVVAIDDDDAGVAARSALLLEGTATSSGQVSINIGGTTVAVAVNSGAQAPDVMDDLLTAINANRDLPVIASMNAVATGGTTVEEIKVTAKNKGLAANEIGLSVDITAAGITVSSAPAETWDKLSGGDGDPAIDGALAAIFSAGHTMLIVPYSTNAALGSLTKHLDSVSGPLEQRGAIGVAGWNGTLSTGTKLTNAVNVARLTTGWHNGSMMPNGEIAAIYAAVIASEDDPARPLNTLTLPGLDITAQQNWPGRTEQENALANGLTPFEVVGNTVQIVRAISTYVKNAEGVVDRALMDITIIRSLDYVRLACRTRISQRFPREKLTDAKLLRIRSELLDVLYVLEGLEIVENVDAYKDQLTVVRNAQDDTRADATIPAPVVRGLHIFAGLIYLL
jgi:phage tail sheath gpL-like